MTAANERKLLESENDARAYVADLCDQEGMRRLERYIAKLIEENRSQNLISRSSEQSVWSRHIADSAQLLEYVPRETVGTWLDLGTGAGLPGLVIAAMRPQIPVVLVESRKRRIDWLGRMVGDLGLSHCRVEGRRLEQVEPFDARFISARAFAPLDKLLRLSAPFSTKATTYLLPKGRSAAQELAQMPRATRKMFHVEHSLTDQEAGIIVSANAARNQEAVQ